MTKLLQCVLTTPNSATTRTSRNFLLTVLLKSAASLRTVSINYCLFVPHSHLIEKAIATYFMHFQGEIILSMMLQLNDLLEEKDTVLSVC